MENVLFNKGIDVWYGRYFENLNLCFEDTERVDAFGNFFALQMEKKKGELCNQINEIFDKNRPIISELKGIEVDNTCFSGQQIEYNIDLQYIRFPDFKDTKLRKFKIRMNINPCFGKKSTMTKIYCTPRLQQEMGIQEITRFIECSKVLCPEIVDLLSDYYFELFKSFVENEKRQIKIVGKHDCIKEIKHVDTFEDFGVTGVSQTKDIYSFNEVITFCAGSDDADTNEFIAKTDDPIEWSRFCRNNPKAKKIIKLFRSFHECSGVEQKLSSFEWFTQNVIVKPKKKTGTTKKASGYIGHTESANRNYFFAIANSDPKSIATPLNLDVIRNN